ncbi:putative oxidoreductase [Lipingzhangella halophila]|uniref:Putative oxidoreductase n=1 Tax=Lipingzhangella halophila TaxID=1783352 RepID=A0A7W7RK96_9ACTN|nr:DoxX family protein [Lipingzhangella halophila]MBB4933559.1 putative oxidoreductase [Lipingzhangella halophila]
MGCLRAGDVAVLGVRTALGATIFSHGTQKLFGWFGGGGLRGTAEGFEQMGYRPGQTMALVAGLGEAAGGASLVLGLGTPAGAAAVAGTMGVASEMHSANGFFNANGGYEYPALIGVTAMSLIVSGAGRVSLDHVTGRALDRPWMRALAGVSVIPAVGAVVARKRAALAADQASAENG